MEGLKETQQSHLYIEGLDEPINTWNEQKRNTTNFTLYMAYKQSKRIGLDLIDFDHVIWSSDVEAIAKTLRKNGIKAFTISAGSGDLVDRLADFENLGYRVAGLVKTKAVDFNGNLKETSALKMEILD